MTNCDEGYGRAIAHTYLYCEDCRPGCGWCRNYPNSYRDCTICHTNPRDHHMITESHNNKGETFLILKYNESVL